MSPSPLSEQHDHESLDALIERSAKRGARLAMSELGLDDDQAPKDLRDLRQLLTSWRRVRREAFEIAMRLVVHLMLVAMVAMATVVLWASGR